ncbi:AMP-binding enzyme [Mycobacterium tilburgii]|uniref:AMP-binding enzyme n=1 Tax=Mycobacterium tilburgii TaxID=44467 RepID=UPI0021B1FE39|nr:AMP-binding protein [Mycobacterium tilburgii]
MSVVPIMLARILGLPERVRSRNPLGSLRVVISSGDRLDPSLARRFMDEYGDVLYNLYGSTEGSVPSRPRPSCGPRRRRWASRRTPGVTGRIFVGGELGSNGYIGGGGKTVIDGHTSIGNMGYVDNAGLLYIVRREDDMIVSGGENAYPRALENALAEHPDIAETAVIGVADEQFGRRLAAFVVPRQRRDVDVAALREFLKGKVSRF